LGQTNKKTSALIFSSSRIPMSFDAFALMFKPSGLVARGGSVS